MPGLWRADHAGTVVHAGVVCWLCAHYWGTLPARKVERIAQEVTVRGVPLS